MDVEFAGGLKLNNSGEAAASGRWLEIEYIYN